MSCIFGWDIGGAHLKLGVVDNGNVIAMRQVACPLWLGLDRLATAMDEAFADLPPADRHAVTMTGELADLFLSRDDGVTQISRAAAVRFGAEAVRFWSLDGFLSFETALAKPDSVASANFYATANLIAAQLPAALLIDVGSTTTDIIRIAGGRADIMASDDTSRMVSGELVYSGVVRTPVMAVVETMPFSGKRIPVMAEHFATMADVHRLCGTLPDHADLHPSADGRGKSAEESRVRLARMIGRDAAAATMEAWEVCAQAVASAQLAKLEHAARLVASAGPLPPEAPVIGAGIGRFLAIELAARLGRPYRSIGDLVQASSGLADRVADAAAAAAVALLLSSSA
jgi:probable H4MPT-linked C1 transfer pathway protein